MEPVGGTFIGLATFCPVKSKVSEFPSDFATPQQRVRVDKAAPHLLSATEFPLDLAMKLWERFENDIELGNPIVDESDWAPPT